MQQLKQGLAALGLDMIDSLGNFITFDCGRPGPELFADLLKLGVIVRPVAEYGLPNHIRVTVGHEHEVERFLRALPQVLSR